MKQTPTIEPIEVPDVVSTLIDSYAKGMAEIMESSIWGNHRPSDEERRESVWKRLKRKFYQRIYDWVVTKDIDTPDYW